MMQSRFSCITIRIFGKFLDVYQRGEHFTWIWIIFRGNNTNNHLVYPGLSCSSRPQKFLSGWANYTIILDLLVKWMEQVPTIFSPNGGEKWWFTMVESVKKIFLNHVFLGDKNRREKVTPVFMFFGPKKGEDYEHWGTKRLGQHWRSYHYSTNILS